MNSSLLLSVMLVVIVDTEEPFCFAQCKEANGIRWKRLEYGYVNTSKEATHCAMLTNLVDWGQMRERRDGG